jgi:hypothetical protein
MKYTPTSPPRDPEFLAEYLWEELLRVKKVLDHLVDGEFEVWYNAPIRPKEGQLVFADGTSWNPGSGRGFYEMRNGAWNKL